MSKIMIPLAEGFEEIEAVTIIDVLRRADIDVITVALEGFRVKGDHDIIITADENIENIDGDELSGIVLPGGMPGAANLRDNEKLINLIETNFKKENLTAAICAAPMVLEKAGVISNRAATSYPGFEEEMPSCEYQEKRVVVDNNIITARGPGVALEFAYKIVSYILDEDKASELKKAMLASNS